MFQLAPARTAWSWKKRQVYTYPTAVSHLQQVYSVDLCISEFEMPSHWWLHQNQRQKTSIRSPGLEHRPELRFRCSMTLHDSLYTRQHWSGKKLDSVLDHSFNINQYHSIQIYTSLAKSNRSLFGSFRSQHPQPFWCSAKELQPHSDSWPELCSALAQTAKWLRRLRIGGNI